MTDPRESYYPQHYYTDQDDKVDLFVLDGFDQNANLFTYQPPPTYPEYVPSRTPVTSTANIYGSPATDDLTQSHAVNIPYVPKPMTKSGSASCEYVPNAATGRSMDDTESPFLPYVSSEPKVTAPKSSSAKAPIRSWSESSPKSKSIEQRKSSLTLADTKTLLTKSSVSGLSTLTSLSSSSSSRALARSNSTPTESNSRPSKVSATTSALPPHTPPIDVDCITGKKVRIAHTPTYDAASIRKPAGKKVNQKQHLRQLVLERYQHYQKNQSTAQSSSGTSVSTTATSTITSATATVTSSKSATKSTAKSATKSPVKSPPKKISELSGAQLLAAAQRHRSKATTSAASSSSSRYQVSTADKNAKRVAHVPNKTPPTPAKSHFIMPISHSTSKIPLLVRRNTLLKLHTELAVHLDKEDEEEQERAVNKAKEIEHDICVRSKNIKSIYVSLGASKVSAIRNELHTNKPAPNFSKTSKKFKQLSSTAPAKPLTKVSHEALLNSKATNYSIVKREKITYHNLPKMQLLRILNEMTIPADKLESYGFPQADKDTFGLAHFPNNPKPPVDYVEGSRITCRRCHQEYINPQPEDGPPCVFHQGRIFKFRDKQGIERQYSCCKGDPQSGGCCIATYHVTDGYEFYATRFGFMETKSSTTIVPDVYALDCEMCYTEKALELSRVTLLDFEGTVVYDTLVKPEGRVLDYNTKFSGIKDGDLDNVTTTIWDVQKELLKRITAESIMVGHGLDSDLRALKLFHKRVVDTTHLFPHKQGLPYKRSLKNLASTMLNKIIQDSVEGHDSNEDARSALDLVKIRLQEELNKLDFSQS